MAKRIKFKDNYELVEELKRQAWLLTDDEINSLSPGNYSKIAEIVNFDYSGHPFEELDKHNLDVEILKVMRNPDFFYFTCKTLFMKDGQPLNIAPFQNVILKELWTKQFPMLIGSRGLGKSFTLALYILLRLIFTPGSKVVIVASAFRQAKVVFEYMEKIWYDSPVLRDLVSGKRGLRGRESGPRRDIDRCEFIIGDSVAVALPLGDGKKIRGLRANYVVAEEFASIPEEIYATVVQGFASVTADPINNMKDFAKQKVLKVLGFWTKEMEEEEAERVRGNQSILSGTAYYAFNHFCKYWKEYRSIIETKGNVDKLKEVLKTDKIPDDWSWKDYSVIRIPYKMIPQGYMDAKTIARAKQITNKSSYLMEYDASFAHDSEGFFPRSLIHKCTIDTNNPNLPKFKSCNGIPEFIATLMGSDGRTYIYGIDPASESDRFSIVIIEVWPDHRRIVYTWTTKKNEHATKVKKGMTQEHNFYEYCARKIRDLMRVFPAERLMVDMGGGGISIREALGDPNKLQDYEQPIYEVIDENKEKITDDMQGKHILEMVNFRNTAWTSEANHGLKKDMEEQVLIFPAIDSLALGLAMEIDKSHGRITENEIGEKIYETFDTLEACMMEIEELKEELSTIVVTTTTNGLEHWDTPDKKTEAAKAKSSGKMRKDRYSSLLMANMGARQIARKIYMPAGSATTVGGFASQFISSGTKNKKIGAMYTGPNWFTSTIDSSSYGAVVRRN